MEPNAKDASPAGVVVTAVTVIAALLALIGHGLLFHPVAAPPPDPQKLFLAALEDSAIRDPRNISGNLVSIRPDNDDLVWRTAERKELLVLTFVTATNANKHYGNPGNSEKSASAPKYGGAYIWVTAAPELQRFCRRLDLPDPSARLRQYLGLRPDSQNDTIVELWVAPENLFRPCPNPDITKTSCALSTKGAQPAFNDKMKNYRDLLLDFHETAYTVDGAPWTGLGYTYDWAAGTRGFGASEFILVPNSNYVVKGIQTAAKYCAN